MPTKWTNLEYYGKKLKKHFTRLDTIITNYYPEGKPDISQDDITHYVSCVESMAKITKAIDGLNNSVDISKRLERIEDLIESIKPEQLVIAKTENGV